MSSLFFLLNINNVCTGFPGGPLVKNLSTNAGDVRDTDSVPGPERSPGIGNGNPLHYSDLENSMDKRTWRVIVHEVTKNQMRLSV